MQYNQPFDQPSNPNASYQNGNPSSGISGSIPPGAAIEYPQREIVNLITNVGLTPTNSDLNQLAKGIQSGQLFFGVDGGTANAYSATMSPALAAYKSGSFALIKIGNTNTGASTLDLGPSALPVTYPNGVPLVGGELTAGMYALFACTGTSFQFLSAGKQVGAPVYLTAPLSYYVNGSTGSDTNDGLSATVTGGHGPFATIQKALNQIPLFNLNGLTVTINVANGTYTQTIACPPQNGVGQVVLVGNHSSPSSVSVVGTANKTACFCIGAGVWQWDGFEFTYGGGTPVATDSGDCFAVGGSAIAIFGNIAFGAAYRAQLTCGPGGEVYIGGFGGNLQAATPWATGVAGNITINGGGGYHMLCGNGSSIITIPTGLLPNYNFATAVTFSGATVCAEFGGAISVTYNSLSGGANVTGTRWSAYMGGMIWTGGGGVNYWPGTVAGTYNSAPSNGFFN